MESNFQKQELKILRFWRRYKIFEKSIRQRAKARDFVFYEGPPTANAKPGIHHVLSRVYKDIICRYKAMAGFRVLRKAGWDTHGLPVELEIEKKLGLKRKKDIEKYGIVNFNKKCRQSVWAYKKDWERLTERIGFWLDMANPYITYDTDYIETLWWIVKRIWEKGLLYQDYKVVPYCPRCATTLSSHEVALGYKTIKEPAIYIKFQIPNSKFQIPNSELRTQISELQVPSSKLFLLVWTTTPWTLPGNVAVAVNPKLSYVAVKKGEEILLLTKERLAVLGEGWEIIKEFQGSDLLGIKYEPLFNIGKEAPYLVIAGDFVSAEEGTGLVHIAPAFGEEDMEVARRQIPNSKFQIPKPVDEEGKMKTPGYPWDGLFVKDADPLIIEDLKRRDLLFREEPYEHDYPFCWRCDSPLLYYAKQSWFIRMSSLKSKLLENNKKINWIPGHLKEGRFGEWLKEVKDWAFSRERYWGTPLPIWQCENCSYKEVIGSKKDLARQKFTTNKYIILRHGESLRNVKHKISNWPETWHCPLTKKGEKQIKLLAKKLKKEKIDLIFSSDLLRTRQTAEIVGRELNIKPKYDPRLREFDAGIFNGWNVSVALERFPIWQDTLQRFKVKVPGGENYNDVKKRMYAFLKAIDAKYQNKKILIISHELPLSVLEGATRGFSDEEILRYRAKKSIKVGECRPLPFMIWPYDDKGNLDFHRPFIDEVKFLCPKCDGIMARVPEVIDVWFDSGAMPFGQAHWPFAWPQTQNSKLKIQNFIKEGFQFPADYICEAVDQTRGWFYTLLAVSTLLGFGPPYKNVISLGHVLDEKGEKMSKSRGNVVDPWQVIEKYGVDAIRWYFFTINQPGDAKLFAEKDIDLALKKFIMTLWNSYLFWETYNKNSKFKIQNSKLQFKIQNLLDKWILSRLNGLIWEVTQKLDNYDVTGAARAIEEFVVEDLSQWYIRRSRRRFQMPKNEKEFYEASATLRFVLLETSKLCAPFIPFLSEAIYWRIGGKNKSIHLLDWPKVNKRFYNLKLEKEMAVVREVIAKALAERAKAKIKVRQPLSELRINNKELKGKKELLDIIAEELNVKRVTIGETFCLDTKITPELKEEGMIRELVRLIQALRKEKGLKPHQFITIFYESSGEIQQLLSKYRNKILAETRARSVLQRKRRDMKEVSIDGERISLGLERKKK